ncbi:MAG: BamA/TamA family outer membrane protein, partial [Gemmatimonadota bacterium]
ELDYIGVPRLGVAMDRFGTAIAGAVATYWSDMLGNRQMMAAVQANGTVKDIGGQVQYLDRSGQLNWGGVAGHIPNQMGWLALRDTTVNEQPLLIQELNILRIYQSQAAVLAELPTSRTRRFEFSAGYTRYGFGLESRQRFFNAAGQEVDARSVDLDPGLLDPAFSETYHMGTATAAYVGDWSYFGFTSPIRGGRFRFEVSPVVGDLNVVNVLGDYRRYLHAYPFTLALRGLHAGRYGPDSEGSIFSRQNFLGYETLVRGYAYESWTQAECTDPSCPAFARLWGSRLAVANAELRVPLFGVPEYGLLTFPFLPTDVGWFVDAGLAWTSDTPCEEGITSIGCSPVLEWSSPDERIPVVSTGVSARFNVMGFLIFEAYYAYPFQRPNKGWHMGFNIAPGW